MDMSARKRRTYDAEFKKNAVLLCDEPDRTVAGVAESLGIPKDMLYRWRRELTAQRGIAFPGHGNEALTDEQRKIRELQKRLQDSEIERDILKKALGIFSRASK
jgi:transposase-like protein